MQRFAGTVEELVPVNVYALTRWIAAISFEEWPQQRRDLLKPAMVTDLAWHGFGEAAAPIVRQCKPLNTADFQWMLSAVMPGHYIEPHIDQQAPYWLARIHVPLATNAKSGFIVDGVVHHMRTGRAYLVNTLREHAVTNNGNTPRLHFMFDIRTP